MTTQLIPDAGLKLAIINKLLTDGRLAEQKVAEFLSGVPAEGSEEKRVAAALARIQAIPLQKSELETIEQLDFDGGNEIYMMIERTLDIETGGESDYYVLTSLEGAQHLTSLKRLDLDAYGYREDELDLRPLANHPSLATLALTGPCTHYEVLETLPKLQKLSSSPADVDEGVLERLRARGVEV